VDQEAAPQPSAASSASSASVLPRVEREHGLGQRPMSPRSPVDGMYDDRTRVEQDAGGNYDGDSDAGRVDGRSSSRSSTVFRVERMPEVEGGR
jgi:hypothetical protein